MVESFTGEETCNRDVAMLTVGNYCSWALKIKQELLFKDIWEAVVGYEDTHGLYIGENFEGDIAEINSANKAWKKFDDLCNNRGLVNGAMNLNQLTHFSKPKYTSVQEYFAKINQLWKKTTKTGYEFTEQQVAGMIIGNLTEELAVCVPFL
ncbi:hypothetical protein PR048_009797 [Dryococelus australis]|uniref:Uncharacterized protein n=1 Tax=Dryococelus australis TaxID=614101 RepID=A0ABQ9I1W2_9NEOP|nr:hypothetical protein PR048_009797 [Dryococelus australis]